MNDLERIEEAKEVLSAMDDAAKGWGRLQDDAAKGWGRLQDDAAKGWGRLQDVEMLIAYGDRRAAEEREQWREENAQLREEKQRLLSMLEEARKLIPSTHPITGDLGNRIDLARWSKTRLTTVHHESSTSSEPNDPNES